MILARNQKTGEGAPALCARLSALVPSSRVRLAGLLLFITAISAAGMPPTQSNAPPRARNKPALTPQSRTKINKSIASVGLVRVRNTGEPDEGLRPRGSAVVISRDGLVVTNYHVLCVGNTDRPYDELYLNLAEDGVVMPTSKSLYRLRTLLVSRQNDLALLKIVSDRAGNPVQKSAAFSFIEIGDSKATQLLDDVYIIGFPEKGGLSVTINRGVIEGKDFLNNWLKTDGRVIRGNSGGAAVNVEGKLIGIPTKVVADNQTIDQDGDGAADRLRVYGAVGYLRPSHLVTAMIAQLKNGEERPPPIASSGRSSMPPGLITPRGLVTSAMTKRPVVGAIVGVLALGTDNVTEQSLLSWGTTDSKGQFTLNKPLPAGKYTMRVKAIGFNLYQREILLETNSASFSVEMN